MLSQTFLARPAETVSEGLKNGLFRTVHLPRNKMFEAVPLRDDSKDNRMLRIIRFSSVVDSRYVYKQVEATGHRLANVLELLGASVFLELEGQGYGVVSLNPIVFDDLGFPCAMFFSGAKNHRVLSYRWIDLSWRPEYRFLIAADAHST